MPAEVVGGDVEGPWEVALSYLAFLLPPPGTLKGDLRSVCSLGVWRKKVFSLGLIQGVVEFKESMGYPRSENTCTNLVT